MRVRVDHRFADEARRYALRFTCEHCGHRSADGRHCAHGWPDAAHRHPPPVPGPGGQVEVEFCKEFELA